LVPLIITLEYQVAHPNCKSVQGLSDGLLVDRFMKSRKQVGPRKKTTNIKNELKGKSVYGTVNGKYFSYIRKNNCY
jgi:hypothetical protein